MGTDRQINGLMQQLVSSVVWKAGHNTGTNARSSSMEFWPVMMVTGIGLQSSKAVLEPTNRDSVWIPGIVRKKTSRPGAIHESVQALGSDFSSSIRRLESLTHGQTEVSP
jgi:hypothetical protein